MRLRPRGAARRGRPAARPLRRRALATTGSPARSARSPATAGACRWCTRCTRWPRSRTPRSPTGDTPEPLARIIGEEQVVEAADMLIANTDIEAKQLIDLYDADPGAGRGRPPRRRPRRLPRRATRPRRGAELGLPGRRARAALRRPDPAAQGARRAAARGRACCSSSARRCARASSSPSSAGRPAPASSTPSRWPSWPPSSASTTSCGSCRRSPRPSWPAGAPPRPLVAVPSYNESFGLVAVEAQATGTPVVAAAVGGLTTVVRDGAQRPAGRRPRAPRLGRRAARGSSTTTGPARTGSARGALEQARQFSLGAHRRAHARGLPSGPARRCCETVMT